MIDMHVHSYWSDGELSPSELIRKAAEINLEGFILTDHDSFEGVKELQRADRQMDIPVYCGVEISCMDKKRRRPVHILGYGLDFKGMEQMESLLRPLRKSMEREMRKSVLALQANGYPVNLQKIYAKAGPGGAIFKQMIMEQLMEAGLCNELYGPLYKVLFKTGRNGTPPIARLNPEYADPMEAVRALCRAGGKAVLAHPGQYDSFDILPDLVGAGLTGIEAYHPIHSRSQTGRCLELAEIYGLKVTGGSDFHGKYGEGESLGQCGVEKIPFEMTALSSASNLLLL